MYINNLLFKLTILLGYALWGYGSLADEMPKAPTTANEETSTQELRELGAIISRRIDGKKMVVDVVLDSSLSLHRDRWKGADRDILKLSAVSNIRSIGLNCDIHDPKTLQILESLPQLTFLSLPGLRGNIDRYVPYIGRCKHLQELYLTGSLTDEGVQNLLDLKQLRVLVVQAHLLTNRSVKNLSRLGTLEKLALFSAQITDDGIEDLQPMANLRDLNLNSTPLTDASVEVLLRMHRLRSLQINNTKMTQQGIQRLVEGLPECKINSTNEDPISPVVEPLAREPAISENLTKNPIDGSPSVYRAYEKLFKDASEKELSEFLESPNPSIALNAIWRKRQLHSVTTFDPDSILFLPNYLEKHCKVPVPVKWIAAISDEFIDDNTESDRAVEYYLKKASSAKPGDVGSINNKRLLLENKKYRSKNNVLLPIDTKLYEEGGKLVVEQNDRSVAIDKQLIPKNAKELLHELSCTALLGSNHSFILFHSELGFSYPIYCVKTSTGEVLWKSFVWANNPYGVIRERTGLPSEHHVFLSVTEKHVTVFGAGTGISFYTESFDIGSGKNYFRFSSSSEEGMNSSNPSLVGPFLDEND